MKLSTLFLFCTGVLLSLLAAGQETGGGLTGRILDTAGAPLAGATVTAVHQPSGTHYETVTSPDGRYHLPGLRVGGPYILSVSYAGMTPRTLDIDQVRLGETLTQNIALQPAVHEVAGVVIKAASAAPRANTFGAGLNIGRDQLRTMPTATRSITDMTRLVPQGSKDNSFAGSNFRYNNVTIDGAINNDAIGFSPSLGGQTGTSNMPGSSTRNNPISLDAIEDMQVYLSPYDVTLGNFSGGSINAVTRSGTNKVTGSIYTYGRNAAITGPDNTHQEQARKMPSDFHDYQVGARVGFPIVKNKVFFFTNEELTRRVDPIQQVAGSAASGGILSLADADSIRSHMINTYGIDPGTAGVYDVYSNSNKFFNRLDWNIGRRTQLVLRNNTMHSEAINMERDQFDFRFAGIGYQQVNNQTSTVAELKTRFNNRWSNSFVAGFTSIHDFRNPLSDPSIPQVQIVGRSPGSTIFLGTDREAAIFNQKQRTIEITDNVTWNLGRHTITMGTHDELYHISYGFVNSWNGRVTYQSIEDFLANNPERVQGNYNFANNARAYILAHPGAVFNVNLYSAYLQDEVQVSDRFKVTYGLRADYDVVPSKQPLSEKTRTAVSDPNFGFSYTYTQMNQINQSYLTRPEISPRIGFRADPRGDQRVILRGGLGIFTSRIPFAWLGYAFYNNGDTYGSFDQKTDGNPPAPFAPGTDPLKPNQGQPGIAGFIANQGRIVNNPNAGQTQVDLIDNHFIMPEVLRGSFAVDYTDRFGFKYTFEALYTKTLKDVLFQQVNIKDNPTYYAYDSALNQRKQPIFGGSINPQFANAYELSNTNRGYRYSLTAQVSRKFPNGFQAMAAYTFGHSMDISNGIRNSMESNWQVNQALNPNNPGLAPSNFDLRHRIVADAGYEVTWHGHWRTSVLLFFSAQSGAPFTYGFVNYTVQNTPQQVSLAYIPRVGESVNFFQSYTDKTGQYQTAAQQAAAFDAFIDSSPYLRSRRGDFTQRNAVTTPWNNDLDFHFGQEFGLGGSRVVSFTLDILNLTNLLDPNWGRVYFVPNTYNSTASVGLIPYIPARVSQGYPIYQFINPGKPYSVDFMASRWQMQAGVRYSF
ncbi:TonB-dependent receptor [Dinghuibacter silviterrae]|uniref:Carboxypeptidase family protein n=1 Tax=Dinghuibacter silviterrae TaxID=1539049 RepID=A0A4V3GKW7_9BACT|nr:carboxypeptidase regulatory-like domain-containing protein [Dinghuibacter silviterrae]TDW97242.1 carboxypeptidase family protein [Dinghuibacter silviterrae]